MLSCGRTSFQDVDALLAQAAVPALVAELVLALGGGDPGGGHQSLAHPAHALTRPPLFPRQLEQVADARGPVPARPGVARSVPPGAHPVVHRPSSPASAVHYVPGFLT